jgi:ribosomal protein L11 methyltransferase
MKYLEITINTLDSGLETLTAFLDKRGIEGTWIESSAVIDEMIENKKPYDWDYIDESILKNREEESKLKFYLEEMDKSRSLLKELKLDLMKLKSEELYGHLGEGIGLGRLYLEEKLVDDESWKENWSEHFKQVQLTDSLEVKSTLSYPDATPNQHTIVLDPGMAFGTGTHETTALCAVLMEKYQCNGKIVLDIGCGSGILSIVAARLGSHKVIGVDIDPIAVETAHENVLRNQCASYVKILQGDLTKGLDVRAQIVVANLVAEAIIELAASVKPCLAGGGIFISSGILNEKQAAVVSALDQQGFSILEILEKGDWCAIAAK